MGTGSKMPFLKLLDYSKKKGKGKALFSDSDQ